LCNGGGEAMVFGQRVPLVQPLNDDASSDAVIVLVRPESLALSLKVEAVEHQMHGAPARVTDIQFLGAVIRVTCDLHVEHNTIKPTELVVVQLSASEMIPGLVPGAEVLIAPRPVAALAIR
jgi:putative spermidine/putrescine transport system ATP-binding protein